MSGIILIVGPDELGPEVMEQLERVAARTDLSLEEVVLRVIQHYVTDENLPKLFSSPE
ncbi:hypothetical protein HY375_01375 [Candidatus Berkelbacteria bacterium]|nr:hypothetical protein [Candidatus Berkelbacteria bacterium]